MIHEEERRASGSIERVVFNKLHLEETKLRRSTNGVYPLKENIEPRTRTKHFFRFR